MEWISVVIIIILLVNTVEELFPIKSDFILSEAYSEVWARLINCAFISFTSLKPSEGVTDYLMYMDILVEMEKFFSLKQTVYVLEYMGLTYKNLYSKDDKSALLRKTMYRENTNVFAYYILTSMFMSDFQGFLGVNIIIHLIVFEKIIIVHLYNSIIQKKI